MVYNKLYSEFVDLFPQDMEWFKAECEEKSADEDDGMHVLFGMVVVPFILEVAIHSPEKLKLAFDFIEKMWGYKVIVAEHPRCCDSDGRKYGNRKVFIGKTNELIRDSFMNLYDEGKLSFITVSIACPQAFCSKTIGEPNIV